MHYIFELESSLVIMNSRKSANNVRDYRDQIIIRGENLELFFPVKFSYYDHGHN
jgi:hypothetical protein